MSRRYDISVIRTLLTNARHIERVIHDLYGKDAAKHKTSYMVADAAGGIGQSCRFETVGQEAGRFNNWNPSGTKAYGDLVDATQIVRDCTTADAIQYLGDLLNASPRLEVVDDISKPLPKLPELVKISSDTLRKLRARLSKSPWALDYLKGRGLDPDFLMDHFGVGLSGLDFSHGGIKRGNWITAPVVGRNGVLSKRIMKITVPGFSLNPLDEDSWCAGAPETTWSGSIEGKRWLFVIQGVRDLWHVRQAIRGTSLEAKMSIISSTHSTEKPAEWDDVKFWAPWERIFLGQNNDAAGEDLAKQVRELACREFLRAEPPRDLGKNWAAFFEADTQKRGVVEFEALLNAAPAIGLPMPITDNSVPLSEQDDGVYEDQRININGAFVNGKMYYPFQVRRVATIKRKRQMPDGSSRMFPEKASYYETRVVRSDGVILGMNTAPAPYGVEEEDKVTVLDDGTEVLTIPKPRDYSTWSWKNIDTFVTNSKRGQPCSRSTGEVMEDIIAFLRQLTWLPNDTDYHLISAYVMMSYCYNAFEAIPLLLLNGEKGSGKTSLAEGIADLSFNGKVLGGGSEKAFVRFIDQGRGLLVLDDLESVGRRSNDEGGYGDINQVLKVSYSKSTGLKSVVEKNGTTRTLNFYGPKVITNISGIDAVNATRMYQIGCRPMPAAVQESGLIRGRDLSVSEVLRQELHSWGMSNIVEADRIYRQRVASRGGRAEQIAAPLETIAEMTGNPRFLEAVQSAIRRLAYSKADNLSAEDFLIQAVEAIIERGARNFISLSQIQAELALMPEARVLDPASAVPRDLLSLQDLTTIGRMLKTLAIRTGQSSRARLSGQAVRYYALDDEFVANVIENAKQERRVVGEPAEVFSPDAARQAFAFCETKTCRSCPYNVVCDAALPGIRAGKSPVDKVRS
ncbi:hypothetical protein [Sulfitobacter sp. BSw21498]|uniref:hypothetical protein n=1 Tax=Sulfitobacter sp. BSw21498 TaxID=664426 RepID=UPI0011107515|nr:hypothetical protein [Sulfitobacter sp. BSw21498]